MDTNLSTIEAISQLLFIPQYVEKVDLIFVFGNDWLQTMDEVKLLYDQKISKYILVSGHSANKDRSQSEAERFMTKGIELGIPQETFILEHNATNTLENFELSLPLIDQKIGVQNIKKILFVCKTFHTRRVLMTARNYFTRDTDFYFFPVKDERNIQVNNWWEDEISRERVLAEIRRIGEYSLKGDLSIF